MGKTPMIFGIPLFRRDRVINTLTAWLDCVDDMTPHEWISGTAWAVEQSRKFPLVPILRMTITRIREAAARLGT